jgi:uncharacterized protein (TIGR03067 family)
VVFVLVLSLSAATTVCGDDKDDVKNMEGTWLAATAELAGAPFPDKIRQSMKLILKGDRYTVFVGKMPDQGTCKVDASKKPKALDITGTDGPNKGKTFLAIYELNGDTLKVCYDLSGKQRPAEFMTRADTQLFLVTYQMEKR